jgi:S-adenosylmethionine:tRNA-ribosyltransferase-isomerase (queuine synthetase)
MGMAAYYLMQLALARSQPPRQRDRARRLPVAHRTHRKRLNHQDFHDVKNNILPFYSILLNEYTIE